MSHHVSRQIDILSEDARAIVMDTCVCTSIERFFLLLLLLLYGTHNKRKLMLGGNRT